MKLAEMTWPEMERVDRGITIVSPIAALEQHSRHLPFFTDSILCEAVASRLEAALPEQILLLPVQWLGASMHHLGMAGSLSAENETYLRLIAEPLRCLLRHQFKRAFILNGHGGNADGFHLALRQLAFEFPATSLCGASYWDPSTADIAALLEGNPRAIGHACEVETSLMLHLRPELVRRSEIADDAILSAIASIEGTYTPLDMKRQTRQGGTGQPTLATAEKGKALLEVIVRNLVQVITKLRARPV